MAEGTCSVEDCKAPVYVDGKCYRHFKITDRDQRTLATSQEDPAEAQATTKTTAKKTAAKKSAKKA